MEHSLFRSFVWTQEPSNALQLHVDGTRTLLPWSKYLGDAVLTWIVASQPQYLPNGTTPELQAAFMLERFAQRHDPYHLVSMSAPTVAELKAKLTPLEAAYIDYAMEHVRAKRDRLCLFIGSGGASFKGLAIDLERMSYQMTRLQGHSFRPIARKDDAGRWVVMEHCGDDTQHPLWLVEQWSPDFLRGKHEYYEDMAEALSIWGSIPENFGW